jgi:hypothetical protein
MRRRYNSNKSNGSARDILGTVFETMRKRGYLARMNFSCCSGCAGYELAEKAGKLAEKGKPPAGCMFWHRQDEGSYKWTGKLAVRYGQLSTEAAGKVGKETKVIGDELVAEIAAEAERRGMPVEVEWDGSPDSTIWVADVGTAQRKADEVRRDEEREARWAAEDARLDQEMELERMRFLGDGI